MWKHISMIVMSNMLYTICVHVCFPMSFAHGKSEKPSSSLTFFLFTFLHVFRREEHKSI